MVKLELRLVVNLRRHLDLTSIDIINMSTDLMYIDIDGYILPRTCLKIARMNKNVMKTISEKQRTLWLDISTSGNKFIDLACTNDLFSSTDL